jgi:hypothetical protein
LGSFLPGSLFRKFIGGNEFMITLKLKQAALGKIQKITSFFQIILILISAFFQKLFG